ncbi:Breast cancer type 1 susceptibility protein isoform X3 [Aix galericulata]|nr:Breast cancer type 1 susceptibility protein isoform X3 [Aix galericulata]
MDLAVAAAGEVQSVLSAMQKNLECPICLDVVKEPVSTKCDHIFCRFCMYKLLSKKKKGVVQCPLCKTEVTKRSLTENSRFKQLIEGLLEAIHAFELDTGVKFLNSHHLPKSSTEATAAKLPCNESSVIQSKGFRNRKRSAKENEQENCTSGANVDAQRTDISVKRCSLRNQNQKRDFEKGVFIELGTDSSEELCKQAGNTGLGSKEVVQISSQEKLEEPKSPEEGNEYSCNTIPTKLRAKEIILPNVIGETDFSKEALSKKSTQNITEHANPDQVNEMECQSSPLNILAPDLLTERCDRTDNASPLKNGDTSFSKNAEEMDAEQTQCSNKSQEFDLEDSSENGLGKSKEIDAVVQSVEDVEMCASENDSEKESPLEKLLLPETPHCPTLHQVSRKRLKRSIQKVNEWFSKSNEILSSNSSHDDPAEASDVSGEGDALSDKDSCISEKTSPVVGFMETTVSEGNKRWSKEKTDSIEDKIFGKTYKRERKSNPPIILREILPTTKKEDVPPVQECLNNSRKDSLKRKRKSVRHLQPEDFIKKKDVEEAGGCPQSVHSCLGDAEKKKCDESSAVKENPLPEKRKGSTIAEFEEGGSTSKNATEKVTCEHSGELELNNSDQKSTKNPSSAAKRCRRSTRTMCALQLVVDKNSASPDPAETLIESYPSSEEPRNADSEQRQVRRSRRLQLLSEETRKETAKRVVIKEASKYDSDQEGPVFGVEKTVLVRDSEYKDLCDQQDISSWKPLTNLESADQEANAIHISPKKSSETAETGNSLFNPAPSRQHSDLNSSSPKAGSQEGEVLGNPFLHQSPSKTVVQTASHLPEGKRAESCPTLPQDKEHCTQNVAEGLRTEKSPMAKNVSELTKESEDSELDTQYLRNIFRNSKRLSFSLYPASRKACEIDDVASEKLKMSYADQVEKRHGKYINTENLHEEKTAEKLSNVCEKEKMKNGESACASPVTCTVSNAECVRSGDCQDVSQVAKQGNLMTPVRMGAASKEGKNRPQKGEQGSEKTASTDVGAESALRQNSVKSSRSQSVQSNTEEHVFQRTDLNTVSETCFSSESDQAEKAKLVDSEGPVLCFQPRSMACPTACHQRSAEFNYKDTEKRRSKRRRLKGDEEPASQTASTGVPECLVAETLEESFKGFGDCTDTSETPDGLMCSEDDSEENVSFCEARRKDRSAVFAKSDLVKEQGHRGVSSKPQSTGIQRARRRAQKLQSSSEESSEDEDLPCFQALIFGKSASTPLQTNKQAMSVVGSSGNPNALSRGGSGEDNVQKTPEAALSNGCASPSQESECSVNLFSSQSNVSEESADGAQELKKPLLQVHPSKQQSNVSESKETLPSCTGGLKRRKTNSKDECQEDPNIGEASGYDTETSRVEDSCGPFSQGEILSTQQKNAMQNNLKKLQQEMAALEAVLQEHGSQDSELLPMCRELLGPRSERILAVEQTRQRGAESTSEGGFENHKCSTSKGFSADDVHVVPSDSSNSEVKELEIERSPELLYPSLKSSWSKRSDLEEDLRHDSVMENKAPQETKPVQEAVQEHSQSEEENADEKSGTKLNEASVLNDLCGNVTRSPNASSSFVKPPHLQTAEATNSSAVAQDDNKSRSQGCKLKRSVCFPTSVLHNAAGKENATNPVVTNRKKMSIVASGLNQSEHMVVQKFARKTQSTFSNHITDGTTHVIMKTDKELVCERTLKYFLGIAGRKWVVSYQWVVQSFKEGMILDEENFEVRGDVINGRNHQGPKRARQSLTEKIFKDFEICCYGPFTDMTTAIQQKNNVAVVTREWVLDSVACYKCQELDAYLNSFNVSEATAAAAAAPGSTCVAAAG